MASSGRRRFLFALDAKTGTLLQGFGKAGQASPLMDAFSTLPRWKTAISVGYCPPPPRSSTTRSTSVAAQREPHSRWLRDGIDAKPARSSETQHDSQDEKEQAWEIAGPTCGGERNGGGVWETAAIDPELNLLFIPVGNPFGDSTKRAGTNLFTDSVIALTLDTGN
jgi:glucose dehydrogenase